MEAVAAVYCDDIEDVPSFDDMRWCHFRVRIKPDTAGNEHVVHASLSLRITLSSSYPSELARVEAQNCVGLSDEDLVDLRQTLDTAVSEMAGECSLFHILQAAKDFVNSRNTPSDDCCICLCTFDKEEQFLKTTCGHCFHVPCVARWVHDQHVLALERAQRDKKTATVPEKEGDEGEIKVQDAKCPICRSQIASDRIAVLQSELRKLQAAHRREAAVQHAMQHEREKAKAAELEARKLEERLQREQRERESFELQPVVVIDNYLENIKVLQIEGMHTSKGLNNVLRDTPCSVL